MFGGSPYMSAINKGNNLSRIHSNQSGFNWVTPEATTEKCMLITQNKQSGRFPER
jgi:hypothetical protein